MLLNILTYASILYGWIGAIAYQLAPHPAVFALSLFFCVSAMILMMIGAVRDTGL